MRVKICGITDPDDARVCAEAGADALGFVVEYPQDNPWNLTRRRAVELMREVPAAVTRVAVVGGDAAWILGIAEATGADELQLHGDEPEDVVRAVAGGLAGSAVRIVKALRVDASVPRPVDYWLDLARRFADAGADAVLVDSVTRSRPAGTGQAVDWALARAVTGAGAAPCILAGGLTPENVGPAVRAVRPAGVDVISAVEDTTHRKVPSRVRAFIAAAKGGGPSPM